jgi:peptide/nickel transport system substrate-binding protein
MTGCKQAAASRRPFVARSSIAAKAIALAIIAAGSLACAQAQELKIGLSAEPSAMDPHFHNLTPNNSLLRHIFDRLIHQDENQALIPGLAVSWRNVDDSTWELKLRSDVHFSDGSEFTANDVIYSICRAPRVENSPSSFAIYSRAITAMRAPDPRTLVVTTPGPYPLLPSELSTIAILSASANGAGPVTFDRQDCKGVGSYPKTEAFNAGPAAIGTGPFKLMRFTKGDRIVLERNDGYWGEKPQWQRVVFRPITSAGPRVAALLSGDVDLIENVPIQDLQRIKASAGYKVVQGLSARVIYLHFDYIDDVPPGVAETGGKNPFQDKRVREAISKAIDRDAIVARIMGGVAMPAGELLPPMMFGADKDAQAPKIDVEGAKKLLAQAGYPNGFTLVLSTPNDRYVERRAGRASGGANAGARRPQGLGRGHDGEPVLCQAHPAGIRLLAGRMDFRHRGNVGADQAACSHSEQGQRLGHDQSGRVLQSAGRCAAGAGARHHQ